MFNRTEIASEKIGQVKQQPILLYYRIRGLAQPIRNLLYHLNISFVDKKLDKNSPQLKSMQTLQSTFDSGLPQYIDDIVKISDSIAICFHICMKNQSQNLIGTNAIERAKINQVLFKYWMQKNKIMPALFEIVFSINGIPQMEKIGRVQEKLTKLAKSSKFLNYCLQMHDFNRGWIHKQLTLIDFFFYEACYYVKGFFQAYLGKDSYLRNFITFSRKFEKLEFHQNQRLNMQTKILFPFKDQMKNQIIISAWNHEENII